MESSKVKKGTWSEEEDALLRKCIQEYGEGKWHLVPPRTGLNRCRKSCRLRWLNYLKPDIKKGEFAVEEVDLIIRLQKLLGNRWSLIAARLPGRTANDVKNYWYTKHFRQKALNQEYGTDINAQTQAKTIAIKPKPYKLPKLFTVKTTSADTPDSRGNICKLVQPNDDSLWWERLVDELAEGEELMETLWKENDGSIVDLMMGQVQEGVNDFPTDGGLWNALNTELEDVI